MAREIMVVMEQTQHVSCRFTVLGCLLSLEPIGGHRTQATVLPSPGYPVASRQTAVPLGGYRCEMHLTQRPQRSQDMLRQLFSVMSPDIVEHHGHFIPQKSASAPDGRQGLQSFW